MDYKKLLKKIIAMLFLINIFSFLLYAGNEIFEDSFIQETQGMISTLDVGLQPSQCVVVAAFVANCNDAARESQYLLGKLASDKVYVASSSFLIVHPHELPSLQLRYTIKKDVLPVIVIEEKRLVSHWTKLKWAAVGAGACVFACGIVSWFSPFFTAQ